jgi:hypothetical protein
MLPLPILDMPYLPRASAAIGDFVLVPILLFVFGYIFVALKRVYRQGWLLTGAKYFVLWMLYMAVFASGVLVAAVLALTTI